MKLKKIAALALAGVMAVSMLAGCAGKGTDDKKDPITGTSTAVATELSKNTGYKDKMTVSASASLQKTLDSVIAVTGTRTDAAALEKYMPVIDSSLTATGNMALVGTKAKPAYDTDSTVQKTYGAVVFTDNTGSQNEKGIVAGLVSALNGKYIYDNVYLSNLTNLPAKSEDAYKDIANNKTTVYHYEFTYTMEVAVSKVENSVTGATTYAAAYVVTRTPAKVSANV